MPQCDACGQPCLVCQGPRIGDPVVGCVTDKGGLWVLVLDDIGKALPGIYGDARGLATPVVLPMTKTDDNGAIVYQSLPPQSYLIELRSGYFPATHEPPAELQRQVTVADRQIAMARFTARRKAELTVHVRTPDPALLVGATLKVKEVGPRAKPPVVETRSAAAEGDNRIGYVRASEYDITLELADPHRAASGGTSTHVRLDPGEKHTAYLEVRPLYTHVRFIAACLATVPRWHYDGTRVPVWLAEYVGLPNEREDMEARLTFLKGAMEEASRQIAGTPATELKIFMVPECFFLGRWGAYQIESYARLVQRLQELVKEDRWKDWIFVFGTVNGVYETTFEGANVVPSEMFNCAPVIRGGFGADHLAADHTRLVQKRIFSSELIDDAELLNLAHRTAEVTNQTVGGAFGGTEYDFVLGRIVNELLNDEPPGKPPIEIGGRRIADMFVADGLDAADWTALKSAARADIAAMGMNGVVRKLRAITLPGTVTSLRDCEYLGFVKTQGVPDIETRQTTPDAVLKVLLDKSITVSRINWGRQPVATKATMVGNASNLIDGPNAPINGLAFRRAKLQPRIATLQAEVAAGNEASLSAIRSMVVENPPSPTTAWTMNWMPMMKLLLTRYLAARPANTGIEAQALGPGAVGTLSPGDYLFSTSRTVAPWRATTEVPADAGQRAEMLLLGLETCADHNFSTVRKLADAVRKPLFLDIHLLPSAGMSINTNNVGCRVGGYIFNCDGWNSNQNVADRGGAILTIPNPNPDALPEGGKNPLKPHSEVLRRIDDTTFAPVKAQDPPVTLAIDTRIFVHNTGQLHIYPPQVLPV